MTTAVILPDPTGDVYGLPTYEWRRAPDGLATRRQLAAQGLRKNGQDPVAQCLRPRRWRPDHPLVAYLYDVTQAAPKRPWTAAKQAAVWKAARSRYRCGGRCGRTDLSYIPPKYTGGQCFDCYRLPAPREAPCPESD